MLIYRLLLNTATVGLLAGAYTTASAQTAVNVQDATVSANKQAVDGSGNAAAKAIPKASATTGGAGRLCTGQILPTMTPPANQVLCPSGGGGPHQVYTWELDNTLNVAPIFFQIFDKSTPVTLATTVADEQIEVPAGVVTIISEPVGDAFVHQITIACTTGHHNATSPNFACGYTVWAK